MTALGLTDRYGLPLSTSSATAVERYVEGMDRMLAMDVDADRALDAALAADDGFALAHAAYALLLQSQARVAEAKAAATQAEARSASLTPREQGHIACVLALVGGGGAPALARIREHLTQFPRESLLLRQTVLLFVATGAADAKQQVLAFFEGLRPAYGDDWAYLSSLAMLLQELDHFDEARTLAERSLRGYPRNAWGMHPLTHVYYETNAHSEGARVLGDWLTTYDRRAPFHCHLSWHLALFALGAGQYQRALAIYERDIAPVAITRPGLLADAASLLWRFQAYGCADALPWEALRPMAEGRVGRPGMGFPDANTGLWCAAVGDEVALGRLIDGLRALDAKGHPVAGSVVLPLVQGLAAFGRGDYDGCIACLAPVADQIVRIGGSNAQREVFEDTLAEAYLRAGRYDEAEALLRRRLGRRPSARDFLWLGRAQVGRGQPSGAVTSLSLAASHWPEADPASREVVALHRLRASVAGAESGAPLQH